MPCFCVFRNHCCRARLAVQDFVCVCKGQPSPDDIAQWSEKPSFELPVGSCGTHTQLTGTGSRLAGTGGSLWKG
jgi:hypothetical protein